MVFAASLLLMLSLTTCAFLVGSALLGRRELSALVPVAPRPLAGALRVIIPARDEEARLGATLEALLKDPHPALQVVVYDDRSTDGTAALVLRRAAEDPRLVLLKGTEEPPAGAFGKPVALSRAVSQADALLGRWDAPLLFLDADVSLAAGALGGLCEAFERSSADALSGVPRFEVRSVVEQLLVPVFTALIGMRHRPRVVHADHKPTAFLNGQLILLRRAAYDDVGGFSSVHDAVLEDVAFARCLKEHGKRLRLADVRQLVSTRMYTSWGEIADGFGKNAVPLLGGPGRALATGSLALLVSTLPPLAVVVAALTGELFLAVPAALVFCLTVLTQASMRRQIHAPLWPVAVLPLAYAGVLLILCRSSLRVLFGGVVTWRGRSYRASRR